MPHSCATLSTPRLRTDPQQVHIDLSRITFCDSVGPHTLVRAHRLTAEAGAGAAVTVAAGPPGRRLLELTGTACLFPDLTAPQRSPVERAMKP